MEELSSIQDVLNTHINTLKKKKNGQKISWLKCAILFWLQ